MQDIVFGTTDKDAMTQRLTYSGWDSGRSVEHLATARFTADMLQTLSAVFPAYQTAGLVTVEVTNQGLWLQNPHTGGRQFLGLALTEEELKDAEQQLRS